MATTSGMAIVGSVVVNPTVVTLTETAETATFPQAGLTIVKILMNAEYVKIPIDATRVGLIVNAGGNATNSTPSSRGSGTGRNVNIPVNGTALNYSIYSLSTSPTVCFYYGTPLQNAKPLSSFAGVVATATLTSGAGSATLTFPSGGLTLTGISATMGLAAASEVLELQFATSAGQTFTAFIPAALLAQDKDSSDIIPTSLPVSQTVVVTISAGTGSDKVAIYGFYQ